MNIKRQRTVILFIVFYGYENWSVTLKEEHKQRELKNKMLRRIFGPKRDKLAGKWREVYSE
jgi:hypothetical protein